MIVIKDYGHIVGKDYMFEHLVNKHGADKVRLVPEIPVNTMAPEEFPAVGRGGKETTVSISPYPFRVNGNEINTRANFRRMRMAQSFGAVDKDEHRLAVMAGDNGTPKQKVLVSKQQADFEAADEIYESEKSRVHSALAGLKAEDLDELAAYEGHTWSASGLKVSEKRAELIAAEVV